MCIERFIDRKAGEKIGFSRLDQRNYRVSLLEITAKKWLVTEETWAQQELAIKGRVYDASGMQAYNWY